nr:hypothetical protein [uncultured Lichenicoccus sp.]
MTVASLATVLTWRVPPAHAADPPGGADNGLPPNASMTPNSMSDVYVQGKYNRTGIYVPPHYEPKPKPVFHGYFDKKKTTVKNGYFDTPKPVKPKTDQDDDDQPGRR